MSVKSDQSEKELLELRKGQIILSKNNLTKQLSSINSAINSLKQQLSATYPIEHSLMGQTHKVTTIQLRDSLKKTAEPLHQELRYIESLEEQINKEIKVLTRAIRKKKNKKRASNELNDFISINK